MLQTGCVLLFEKISVKICALLLVTSSREQVVAYWIQPISVRSGVLLCNGHVKLWPVYSQQVIPNLFIAFMRHGSITYTHYLQTCLLNKSCSVLAEKSLSQSVAITDTEIKGSVSFWDLSGADYSQLPPTCQTLWSVLLPACAALTGSPWLHDLR